MNCKTCHFKEWDGIDHACTAHFDGLPGHPFVDPESYSRPDWCPLSNPQRVTRQEIERAMHPTVAAAIVGMYLNNGDSAPQHLCIEAPMNELPRGDK